jgi:hypothetical protein
MPIRRCETCEGPRYSCSVCHAKPLRQCCTCNGDYMDLVGTTYCKSCANQLTACIVCAAEIVKCYRTQHTDYKCADCTELLEICVDNHYRCSGGNEECKNTYDTGHTCSRCTIVNPTTQRCSECRGRFCDGCNPITNIDISPTTLHGHGRLIRRTTFWCRDCMADRTVAQIQDLYRRGREDPHGAPIAV